MALDDGFADVEAEAKANAGAAFDFDAWDAVEALPDVFSLSEGEAWTIVGDGEASEWPINQHWGRFIGPYHF